MRDIDGNVSFYVMRTLYLTLIGYRHFWVVQNIASSLNWTWTLLANLDCHIFIKSNGVNPTHKHYLDFIKLEYLLTLFGMKLKFGFFINAFDLYFLFSDFPS